jgi:hypothetical protein
MVRLWSEDPFVLLESPLELVYYSRYSPEQNVNALARFVIYWSVFSFAITKQSVILVIGAILLFFMRGTTDTRDTLLDTQGASMIKYCHAPSVDNPMANPLLSDYGDGVKLPACPYGSVRGDIREALNSQSITGPAIDSVNDDSSTRLSRRQFYTVPSTTVPNERDAFVHSLYGSNIDRKQSHDDAHVGR